MPGPHRDLWMACANSEVALFANETRLAAVKRADDVPPEFVLLKPANLRVVSKLGLTQCPHSPLWLCTLLTVMRALCVVQVSKLGPDGVG